MCPFCMLTAAVIVSGTISAGGLGAFLIGKAKDDQAETAAAISHPRNSTGSAIPEPWPPPRQDGPSLDLWLQ